MSRYSWLLFDADGTLFDYNKAESTALRDVFRSFDFGFTPECALAYREINDRYWRDFELGLIDQKSLRSQRFSELLDSLELEADPELFSRKYLEFLSMGTYLIDGVEEVLDALHPLFDMAILTNGLQDVQRPRFTRSSIGSYFKVWIISEEVGFAKPDPAIFDVVFDLIGHPPPDEVLMIGDSLTSDIAGGLNYGIDTCWFNPSNKQSPQDMDIRYEINDLSQLQNILTLYHPR
jgi:2-haloacid dehalogenase